MRVVMAGSGNVATVLGRLIKKAGLSRFRIYINGTNLISFDNVKEYQIDPEISSSGGLVYPQQRLVNFGFNLTF